MLNTKTRMQGNSVVVTLPSATEFKISPNEEYIVTYGDGGSIMLVPKIDNPFLVAEKGAFYETDEWEEMEPLGNEL
ncbi:type II toxin-antitoxin system PemI/MazE family antitoxin [Fundicoccus culcitae]|uniref:AbrB family transcriptional regulator n=1 Tax=Fundicoccus culcitae TaxID=2969821 RepID=A0ABY5P4U3_9LACT|nr:AbrB family transcriptional regulator [Fundicoccus culcitae]UUX33569.1 AbrB family transcriptional regulator [Fundicoccus culcitae]